MQFYSDAAREREPFALPDAETFYCPGRLGEEFDELDAGWYYQACFPGCFPGCLPDGEPVGPFDTEAEAIADARGFS